jgi:hypothetical protein
MPSIDVKFSESIVDQQALSAAGGFIHLPDSKKKPVFRFRTFESYQEFKRLRDEMKKNAMQGVLGKTVVLIFIPFILTGVAVINQMEVRK